MQNGSKLHPMGISNDVLPGTASGWWPAACSIIRAGVKVCFLQLLLLKLNLILFLFKTVTFSFLFNSSKTVVSSSGFSMAALHSRYGHYTLQL